MPLGGSNSAVVRCGVGQADRLCLLGTAEETRRALNHSSTVEKSGLRKKTSLVTAL